MNRSLSSKQLQIMAVVLAGDGHDESGNLIPVDLDGLIDRLKYKPTKDSMHFSIRSLVKHGMIRKAGPEMRRLRFRSLICPTSKGIAIMTGKVSESFLEPEDSNSASLLELLV